MVALVAYLRASKEGPSTLAEQEAAVRAWAQARRHRIVAVLHDLTAELERRRGLAEAFALVGAGQASGLVMSRIRILADHVVEQEQLVAEIRRLGGRVHVLSNTAPDGDQGVGSDTVGENGETFRRLVREVLHRAAGNERSIQALRTWANGRSQPTAGAPRFGFRVENGELRATGGEQAVLARITELQQQGESLRQIVRILTAEGHQPKRAQQWHPETIRRILNRQGT